MKVAALQKARARLIRARRALSAMNGATDFYALEDSWSQFLLAADLVFSTLGTGAKGCDASEPWFGRKLHEQKQDELLRFLYSARNAEEHGIERSLQQAYRVDVVPGVELRLRMELDAQGNAIFRREDDASVVVAMPLTGAAKSVTDRHGVTHNPPTLHCGNPVEPTVFEIARLGIAHLESLVDEAERLPPRE